MAEVKRCSMCHRSSPLVSSAIGICGECLREQPADARAYAESVHARTRSQFDLPPRPPRDPNGVPCSLCGNECRIGENERGFCGLRTAQNGVLEHLAGTPERGLLHWYRDPLPTNCVADWVCEGSRHRGDHNLAVFYASCTADCLFCQNWHFREPPGPTRPWLSASELASAANAHTFCVCYFGGDPASQMPHALAASRLLARQGVRVCWETNGTMNPQQLDAAVTYSLETGGCIKFDLKAFHEPLHVALTGISNRRTLENFARAVRRFAERPHPPLVVASTLLVPGYVDAREVEEIARFVAGFDPHIPYSLLAFAPAYCMSDLPCTSASHAQQAESAARGQGLLNVRVGNRHLLGWE
jgi:pyruvate formate lyase activating enzyme